MSFAILAKGAMKKQERKSKMCQEEKERKETSY